MVFRSGSLAFSPDATHPFSAYFSVSAALWFGPIRFSSGSTQTESDGQSVAETLAFHSGRHRRQGFGVSEHLQGGVIEQLVTRTGFQVQFQQLPSRSKLKTTSGVPSCPNRRARLGYW